MSTIVAENVQKLPYEQISSEPIREAVAGLSAARAALHQSKRDLIDAQQTLPSSEWKDAEEAEKARAEGRAEPKRVYTQQHEKRIADLGHEQRVCELALQRAEQGLDDTLGQHGEAWGEEVRENVEALRAEWGNAIRALIALHGSYGAALTAARVAVGEQLGAAAVRVPARLIKDLEIASGQRDPAGIIATGDVLGALAGLGMPEPELERGERAVPMRFDGSPLLRGQRGVEDEIAGREREHAELTSPDVIEQRRRRAEECRQQNELAEQVEA